MSSVPSPNASAPSPNISRNQQRIQSPNPQDIKQENERKLNERITAYLATTKGKENLATGPRVLDKPEVKWLSIERGKNTGPHQRERNEELEKSVRELLGLWARNMDPSYNFLQETQEQVLEAVQSAPYLVAQLINAGSILTKAQLAWPPIMAVVRFLQIYRNGNHPRSGLAAFLVQNHAAMMQEFDALHQGQNLQTNIAEESMRRLEEVHIAHEEDNLHREARGIDRDAQMEVRTIEREIQRKLNEVNPENLEALIYLARGEAKPTLNGSKLGKTTSHPLSSYQECFDAVPGIFAKDKTDAFPSLMVYHFCVDAFLSLVEKKDSNHQLLNELGSILLAQGKALNKLFQQRSSFLAAAREAQANLADLIKNDTDDVWETRLKQYPMQANMSADSIRVWREELNKDFFHSKLFHLTFNNPLSSSSNNGRLGGEILFSVLYNEEEKELSFPAKSALFTLKFLQNIGERVGLSPRLSVVVGGVAGAAMLFSPTMSVPAALSSFWNAGWSFSGVHALTSGAASMKYCSSFLTTLRDCVNHDFVKDEFAENDPAHDPEGSIRRAISSLLEKINDQCGARFSFHDSHNQCDFAEKLVMNGDSPYLTYSFFNSGREVRFWSPALKSHVRDACSDFKFWTPEHGIYCVHADGKTRWEDDQYPLFYVQFRENERPIVVLTENSPIQHEDLAQIPQLDPTLPEKVNQLYQGYCDYLEKGIVLDSDFGRLFTQVKTCVLSAEKGSGLPDLVFPQNMIEFLSQHLNVTLARAGKEFKHTVFHYQFRKKPVKTGRGRVHDPKKHSLYIVGDSSPKKTFRIADIDTLCINALQGDSKDNAHALGRALIHAMYAGANESGFPGNGSITLTKGGMIPNLVKFAGLFKHFAENPGYRIRYKSNYLGDAPGQTEDLFRQIKGQKSFEVAGFEGMGFPENANYKHDLKNSQAFTSYKKAYDRFYAYLKCTEKGGDAAIRHRLFTDHSLLPPELWVEIPHLLHQLPLVDLGRHHATEPSDLVRSFQKKLRSLENFSKQV